MVTRNSVNTYIVPTTASEVTAPAQPAFMAYLGTTDSNVTGDGTTFQLGSGNVLTEVFDLNSDFNVNGTFTAPVTGRYFFDVGINCLGFDGTQTSHIIQIVTSHGSYQTIQSNPTNCRDSANEITAAGSVLCDMTAADTATVLIKSSNGNKTVDISGTARLSYFSGNLAV